MTVFTDLEQRKRREGKYHFNTGVSQHFPDPAFSV